MEQLGCSRELAAQILAALRTRYRGVAAWRDAVRTQVKQHGSITTPWGRSRRFLIHPGLDRRIIEDQLRESINAPNQGMSSDVNLSAFAELESQGVQTLFPFHDAIYVQAPESEAERTAKLVKSVMEAAIPGAVRFEADVKSGLNWAALG